MISYKLTLDKNIILRLNDNAYFGAVSESTDYQEYLRWLEEGNTPEPPDENEVDNG